jgi:membrane associated rhomboid family serine protease
VQQSAGDELRQASQRSWIALLGLVGIAILASLTSGLPDLITTVAAIIGVAGMIYGVAIGVLIVLNREPDE